MPSIKIDVFEVEIEDVSESFQFKSEVSKLKQKPCYRFLAQIMKQFLKNISMIWVKKNSITSSSGIWYKKLNKNKSPRDAKSQATW